MQKLAIQALQWGVGSNQGSYPAERFLDQMEGRLILEWLAEVKRWCLVLAPLW